MIYINSSDAEHRNFQFKQKIMQFSYAWPITTVKTNLLLNQIIHVIVICIVSWILVVIILISQPRLGTLLKKNGIFWEFFPKGGGGVFSIPKTFAN